MNTPLRILGIGSPLGDDQAGWLAAQALEGGFPAEAVAVSWHDRPGARLVQLMQGAVCVILIDAVRSGAPVGTLHRLEGAAVRKAVGQYTSTHGFGLAEALALAEKLGTLPPQVVLFGVEIDPRADQSTSPEVAEALPALVEAVNEEVRRFISAPCVP